ncbi:MAG TPA: right-handed parallel beta-helix repeat-containing protein [Candidatus Binatus sp.]|nr:right-handed parallel beta-helix repeat-containing protein [Candidatus Binatus sp.]
MSRLKFVLLVVSACLLTVEAPVLHATTYVVGTCKVGTQFTKIQDALNATPAPTIVEVCPGKYPEQVTITRPVTLQGVPSGNSSYATLVVPSSGLVNNATLLDGGAAAVQILVKNVDGTVVLTNLVVDATNNSVSGAQVVGILYMNTPGTINHTVTFNDENGEGGIGMYLEGGSANPKVTVENSTLDHDNVGIWVQSSSTSSELTATIQNNLFNLNPYGIQVFAGATVTISGNTFNNNVTGIYLDGSSGSAVNNTFVYGDFGFELKGDGISIKSNKIYNAAATGIDVETNITKSVVTGNVVTTAPTGIEACHTTGSPNMVHSNTFVDTATAYEAESGFPTTGSTYLGVTTILQACP